MNIKQDLSTAMALIIATTTNTNLSYVFNKGVRGIIIKFERRFFFKLLARVSSINLQQEVFMFVENYRRENSETIMAGGEARPMPYPKISDEDWRVWKTSLPVMQEVFNPQYARDLREETPGNIGGAGIPREVILEINHAADFFPKIEIWRKKKIDKDPIAVGVLGQERFLIARWGMEKLMPFDAIKKSMPFILAWKYATSPLGVLLEIMSLSLLAWHMII